MLTTRPLKPLNVEGGGLGSWGSVANFTVSRVEPSGSAASALNDSNRLFLKYFLIQELRILFSSVLV
jgi:hypothetical protein